VQPVHLLRLVLPVCPYEGPGGQRLFEALQLPSVRFRPILFFRDFYLVSKEMRPAVEDVKPVVRRMGLARFASGVRKPVPTLGTVFNGFWNARHGLLVSASFYIGGLIVGASPLLRRAVLADEPDAVP
jgi:hypothetical protein